MRLTSNAHERIGLAASAMLAVLAAVAAVWQGLAAQPATWAGLTVDRLSSAFALLVGVVGTVVFAFSIRYMDGQACKRRFLRWLMITVVAAYTLMLATHLLVLLAVWLLTSIGLHRLLTINGRAAAHPPARKKFLISRLGDVAMIAAIYLIWHGWGTLDLHEFLRQVAAGRGAENIGSVGVLVAIAALTKSAQFPFHSWLPETMEAPTPVSALMHAGVINAGGVLLLRMAPVITASTTTSALLTIVGSITLTLGMLALWAQVKVKRTLAWSTVSQMGFMIVQCGLGVFGAAALHIIGHGCYKAWSFLWSGEVDGGPIRPTSPARSLTLGVIGTLAAIPALVLASDLTGFNPLHTPGELALTGIFALSIGQVWAAMLRQPAGDWRGWIIGVLSALAVTVGGCVAALALYAGAAAYVQPVTGPVAGAADGAHWLIAALPVAACGGLVVFHALLPVVARRSWGSSLYVHALHGFYLGAVADRVVAAVWPSLRKDVQRA